MTAALLLLSKRRLLFSPLKGGDCRSRRFAGQNDVEESPDSKKERCRVTPGRGNPTDSATEMKPLPQRSGNRN